MTKAEETRLAALEAEIARYKRCLLNLIALLPQRDSIRYEEAKQLLETLNG